MQIIIDKQEKDPLHFSSVEGVSVVVEHLKTGDYACRHKDGALDLSIVERKSCADLYHSFTHEYDNEKAKIQRAKEDGQHYILAIEASALDIRKGHSYWKSGELHQVKKDGLSQVRQIITIQRKYGVEVWWCNGRIEMSFLIQEYFLTHERMMEMK